MCTSNDNFRNHETSLYYYCNRSSKYSSKESGSCRQKFQGSCKLGNSSTGYIKASENIILHSVYVEYCFHHNHVIQLDHLTMDEQLKAKVAVKCVSEKKILDKIQNNVHNGIGREHLITIQDIQNIRHQYNIEGIQHHQNDHQSVELWIFEYKKCQLSQTSNPVLLYKTWGTEQADEVDNIAKDDILFCIQTEFQKDLAMKFGVQIICVNSTHGTQCMTSSLLQ